MPSGCFSRQISCTSKGTARFFSYLSGNTIGCFQSGLGGEKIIAWVKLFFLPVFELSAINKKTTTTLCHMSTWHVPHLQTLNLSHNSDSSKETFLFFRWEGIWRFFFFFFKWTQLEESPREVRTTQVDRWWQRRNQLNSSTTKEQPRLR